MAKSQEFHAQTLVNSVWSLAKLASASEPFLAAGCARALTLVQENAFNAQDLTNTAWALATTRFAHLELLDAIGHRLEHVKLSGQDLANGA